jgi:hypothetical protein
MAKEEKKPEGKKGKKKHLTGIMTHKAEDGGFVHEHHYKDEDGNESKSFGGVSADMDDLQQHMQDHLGPQATTGDDEESGAPPGAGAAPGAAPPAAGPPTA